jgi:hypothetical protein
MTLNGLIKQLGCLHKLHEWDVSRSQVYFNQEEIICSLRSAYYFSEHKGKISNFWEPCIWHLYALCGIR